MSSYVGMSSLLPVSRAMVMREMTEVVLCCCLILKSLDFFERCRSEFLYSAFSSWSYLRQAASTRAARFLFFKVLKVVPGYPADQESDQRILSFALN